MTVSAARPLDTLADSLKAYRVTGMNRDLQLSLSPDAAEALETLPRLYASWEAIAAEREARITAEARRVEGLRAEAVRALDRLRLHAVAVVAWSSLLSLFCIAWAVALAGVIG